MRAGNQTSSLNASKEVVRRKHIWEGTIAFRPCQKVIPVACLSTFESCHGNSDASGIMWFWLNRHTFKTSARRAMLGPDHAMGCSRTFLALKGTTDTLGAQESGRVQGAT